MAEVSATPVPPTEAPSKPEPEPSKAEPKIEPLKEDPKTEPLKAEPKIEPLKEEPKIEPSDEVAPSRLSEPEPPKPATNAIAPSSEFFMGEDGVMLRPVKPPPGTRRLLATNKQKLVDILNPILPPLPVELPPIGDVRKANYLKNLQKKTSSIKSTGSVAFLVTKDGVQVPFVEGDDLPNPFQYPQSIEEFIAKSDEKHAQDRKKVLDPTINPLMKGTNLYKQNQTVLARIKPFLQPSFKPSLAHDYKQVIWKAQNGLHINHLQKVSRKMHSEYISQRKSIYYLRRAIKARKVALEMIGKTREFEEACLKDYEWLTDFTKQAFEDFLKENDDLTHEAARKAEIALKEKLDKGLEIRKLSIQINQMKTDIIATNDSLRECKTYTKFLQDISKEIERMDEEAVIRAAQREVQVREELLALMEVEEGEEEGMSLEEAQLILEEKGKEFYEDAPQGGRRATLFGTGSREFLQNLKSEVRSHLGLTDEPLVDDEIVEAVEEVKRPSFDDDDSPTDSAEGSQNALNMGPSPLSSAIFNLVPKTKSNLLSIVDKEEKKMFEKLYLNQQPKSSSELEDKEDADGYNGYALLQSLELVPGDEESDRSELGALCFTSPSQLLRAYSDMEETILSLIQHSQTSEEILEKVNAEVSQTKKELRLKDRTLREDINRLQTDIDANEERTEALTKLIEMFTGGNYNVREQQKLYRVLKRHIARVFKTAIGQVEEHLTPIMMLTSIEKNFEDLMREIQAMPTEVVLQISRELDKERREMERLEKMNQRKVVQEERKSRAMDRANAPIHRRKGRPLLARSRPPKVVIKLTQAEIDKKAETDELNSFMGTNNN